MIAVDTQLLVYAHRGEAPWHVQARDRIVDLASSGSPWAIPMHCLVEFYANVTNARFYAPASTPSQAIAQTEAWLEAPTVVILSENAETWSVACELLVAAKVVGNHAYDARIAAVCLQYDVTELWTNDRDFLRFPALRVRNPLIEIHPTRAGEPRASHATRTRVRKRGAAR
jgi:toxin-antitoxin system PIN domain toxin